MRHCARCVLILVASVVLWEITPVAASGDTVMIHSDATWRTSRGTVEVTPDWVSAVDYDDSDGAGWIRRIAPQWVI